MFYIDAVLYATPDGGTWETTDYWPNKLTGTLAHETQHMISYYQNSVLQGVTVDTWLNELCSMMTEDLLSRNADIAGPRGIAADDPSAGTYPIYDGRLPRYNYYNDVSVTAWYGGSDVYKSYSINYAFGAYLGRNYGGAPFFSAVYGSSFGDHRAVEDAVAASGETLDFGEILRRWAIANLASDKEGFQQGYLYNNGQTWLTSSADGNDYYLGSINLYNYSFSGYQGPYIYSSVPVGDMPAAANVYTRAASSMVGIQTWQIGSTDPAMNITVVVK